MLTVALFLFRKPVLLPWSGKIARNMLTVAHFGSGRCWRSGGVILGRQQEPPKELLLADWR